MFHFIAIAILTLLQWSRTKPPISLRYAYTSFALNSFVCLCGGKSDKPGLKSQFCHSATV